MGKVIVIGTVVIILAAMFVWFMWYLARDDKPTRKERKFQDISYDAAKIFQELMLPSNVNDMDILTEKSRKSITGWLEKYRKVTG